MKKNIILREQKKDEKRISKNYILFHTPRVWLDPYIFCMETYRISCILSILPKVPTVKLSRHTSLNPIQMHVNVYGSGQTRGVWNKVLEKECGLGLSHSRPHRASTLASVAHPKPKRIKKQLNQ